MELIIKKCPICGEDGDEANVCEICGRDNFSAKCFDEASRRCLHCQWDPRQLCAWADNCKIPDSKLPRERKALANLKRLELTANAGIYSVKDIPAELANLTGLERLWIAAHPVREFPGELAGLRNLTHVSLDTLELDTIPDFIFELPKIERLSLMNNKLTKLPDRLSELQTLKCLILSVNQIRTLDQLPSLPNLEELYIWDNNLTALPAGMSNQLPALKILNVDNNPLDDWLKNNSSQLAQYKTFAQ